MTHPPVWPPQGTWGPPPAQPTPAPAAPTRDYPWFWRVRGIPFWKPLLVVVLGVVGFFVISLVVSLIGLSIDLATTTKDIDVVLEDLVDGEVSKVLFIANSVGLGLMVPLALVLQRLVGQPVRYLHSVVGRFRWRWGWTAFWVSVLFVVALIALLVLLGGWETLGLSVQPGWWWFLLAILVVTPFQAAGEEYLLRGLLNRAVASWFPWRRVALVMGAVVSSVVFMLLHGAGDLWLNINYFIMGLLFCHLTWRTGGLEAAVALHTANNVVSLAMVPFQEWGGIFDREAGVAGPEVLFQIVFLAACVFVLERIAKRRGLATEAPAELVRPPAPPQLPPGLYPQYVPPQPYPQYPPSGRYPQYPPPGQHPQQWQPPEPDGRREPPYPPEL